MDDFHTTLNIDCMSPHNLHISVVIPTMGRINVLQSCLEHLLDQTIEPAFYEILIVDDTTDESVKDMVSHVSEGECSIRYYRGTHKGVGPARNRGVIKAKSHLVVIIGDDIIVTRDFLHEHLKFHKQYNESSIAVLGQTKLHKNALKSPFMRTWGDLPFSEIAGQLEVPPWFFFTGNISFKREFFLSYGMFDECFRKIGWEDVAVGFKLFKHNGKIYYNHKALGYHDHAYTFEDACKQQLSHGYNFGIMVQMFHRLELPEYIDLMAEKYGILGWGKTTRKSVKDLIKSTILHHKIIMVPLRTFLQKVKKPGRISTFLYPKLFNYYFNQGLRQYKHETGSLRKGKTTC